MKGKWLISVLAFALCCLICAPQAPGAQEGDEALRTLLDELPAQERERLGEIGSTGGILSFDPEALLASAAKEAEEALAEVLRSGATILLVVLLCSSAKVLLFQEKGQQLQRCVTMSGALAIVLLAAGDLNRMIGLGGETIRAMNDFSKVLLPMLGMACAASGNVSSAAVREVATTFFADLLISSIHHLLVPLVYIYIGAVAAHAVLGEASLKTIAAGIKKGIVWGLTILLTLFTAYLSFSGVISGTADAAAVKMTKFAISGAVPVVGGILSNAASTVLLGAAMMKNMIGVFGMLAVLAFCIVPFIQIGMQYLLYKAAAFFAAMIDHAGLSAVIDQIGGAFGMLLGMTGACALLLMISIITSILAVMPV